MHRISGYLENRIYDQQSDPAGYGTSTIPFLKSLHTVIWRLPGPSRISGLLAKMLGMLKFYFFESIICPLPDQVSSCWGRYYVSDV